MKSKDYLVSSRLAAFKFLLRCQRLPELGLDRLSALGKLSQFLVENEKELVSQSVDLSFLKYDIDLATVVNSSFVGLFWLDGAYSEVLDVCGVKEFTKGDVLAGHSLYPEGFHGDYIQNPNKNPRGRVSLLDGRIKINVGLQCPDDTIPRIIDAFGLDAFEGKVSVSKGMHWDPK